MFQIAKKYATTQAGPMLSARTYKTQKEALRAAQDILNNSGETVEAVYVVRVLAVSQTVREMVTPG